MPYRRAPGRRDVFRVQGGVRNPAEEEADLSLGEAKLAGSVGELGLKSCHRSPGKPPLPIFAQEDQPDSLLAALALYRMQVEVGVCAAASENVELRQFVRIERQRSPQVERELDVARHRAPPRVLEARGLPPGGSSGPGGSPDALLRAVRRDPWVRVDPHRGPPAAATMVRAHSAAGTVGRDPANPPNPRQAERRGRSRNRGAASVSGRVKLRLGEVQVGEAVGHHFVLIRNGAAGLGFVVSDERLSKEPSPPSMRGSTTDLDRDQR